jgi:hypothetical protein
MTSALPGVARAVDVATRHGTAVLGGGLGFGPQGRYARAVGVTACDRHVSEAARRLALWDGTGCPEQQHAAPEPIAYRRRHIAEEIAESLLDREVDPAGAEILRDATDQVVALALAAARTGHASILDEGVVELVAVLTERPEPPSAIAARLPVAAHAVVDRYRRGP